MANKMMGIIRRTYRYLNVKNFVPLYKSLVRSHLDYCVTTWAPYKKHQIDAIEKVQRRATKQIPEMNNLSYSQRLQKLELPSLSYRRFRADMIETFKIVTGIYDKETSINLNMNQNQQLRGHKFKLAKERFNTTQRKHFFRNRIVSDWNSLPPEVIDSSSLNMFKNRLDKYWSAYKYQL